METARVLPLALTRVSVELRAAARRAAATISSGAAAPLVRTGQTRHCLNLGSYNYLGFGGIDAHCTPEVIGTLQKHGVSSCSSRLRLTSPPARGL